LTEPGGRGRTWLALAGAAVAVYLLAAVAHLEVLRLLVKPVPAAGLALWVYRGAPGSFARRIALGLALSAVADAVIEASFLAGLAIFLLAHLAYLAGFLTDCRAPAVPRALPLALYGVGMFAVISPGLGSLRMPVLVYMVVITAMVWRAAARVGQAGPPSRGEWAGFLGAAVFAASDSLIAWNRFVAPFSWAPYAIILLYWMGQAGIAASARQA
jgi:alkenylglycerophosphocholine/alkenylglycerophosphoethanolamine hydrolase